ncbi:MAG: hypothetical protein FJW30_16195 [Acidobacteria bacterium]|nr:hypothetical protein [Acidobacteriota bacterium]
MFDFFRSRDKAARTVLTVLLGMVALSMVTYLVPGGPGSGNPSETVVAEVCGDKINAAEVQRQLQNQLRNRNLPAQMIQSYIPEFINQFVAERASACHAEEMGIRVTEEEVANAIRSMLPQILGGGYNKELYTGFLREQGLTIPEFEANVAKQMRLNRLRIIVMEGMVVGPQEVEEEFRRRNEKIKVEYVRFGADKFQSQVKVTPEELQTYFNANRTMYRTPEKRSFEILVASEDRFAANITLDDNLIRQAYNNAGDRYRSGERVKVRHILVSTAGKSADDAKKAEAKANDLLAKIKGGGDFAKLAQENSDDPGSKDKGGEYGWMSKGQTVANFESTAFSLKKGDISGLVKTEYGFHIIQTLDREDARVKPFEEVKGELAAEVRKQRAQSMIESAAEQARAELVKSPGNGAAIAAKFGLAHFSVADAASGGPLQEVGLVQELDGALFSAQKGGVTNLVVAPGNKMVFGVVNNIAPPRPAEFNEVESQVRSAVTAGKTAELAAKRQKEVEEMVKQGADLKRVAASVGVEVKSSNDFTRDGAAEGIGTGTHFTELFGKEPGAMLGPMNISDQTIVVRLVAKTPADLGKLAAERDTILAALKSRRAQERKDLFEDGLVAKMVDRGKVKLNQDAIRRLIDSYRG